MYSVEAPDFMIEIAREAGTFLAECFGRNVGWRYKNALDVVSDADLACEELIVSELRERFPQDGIVAEEGTLHESTSGRRWLVDPLDGTKNFIRGNPCFSVTLALERDGEVLAGVVFDPMRDEMFCARRGHGSYCNDSPITVSQTRRLNEAVVTTSFPSARRHREMKPEFFYRLAMVTQGLRRSGSTALDLAYVAAGRFDMFWDSAMPRWDVAAGLLLVAEAGGRHSDVTDGTRTCSHVIAGNAELHNEAIALLRDCTRARDS